MMSCQEFADQVTDYLEGRVGLSQKWSMWLHATLCGHCRRYMRQVQDVVEAMGALAEEPGPGDEQAGDQAPVPDDLMAAFRARAGGCGGSGAGTAADAPADDDEPPES